MITELSDKQWELIAAREQEYFEIGTCCEPADFDTGDEVLKSFYKRLGKPEPMILHFSSPLMCELACGFIFDSQLDSQLYSQLRSQLYSQLDSQLYSQLRSQLSSQLDSQLRSQLSSQLDSQLYSQLRSQLSSQLDESNKRFLHNRWGGQQWCATEAYFGAMPLIGVIFEEDGLALLQEWDKLARSVCWWAAWDGLAIVSDRPRTVRFENGLLHSEKGKAVEFSDGWGVSSWFGTIIPDHWLESGLDPMEVLRTENAEQKAAGCQIIGWPTMLSHLDHKVIDSEEDPQKGSLIELSLEGLPEPELYLKFNCPRNGEMMEGVNKHELSVKTVMAAHAWKQNIPLEMFNYPTQRT